MVARVDRSLFHSQVWMRLHCHSFLCVVSHDIFEDFCLWKYLPILVVANEPQTRGLVVKVVGYAQIVGARFLNSILRLVHHYVFVRSKNIHASRGSRIVDIIYIHCFLLLFLLLVFINVDRLINIYDFSFSLRCASFNRVISLHPSIFDVTLLRFLLLQLLDPLEAGHFLGYLEGIGLVRF